MIVIAVVVDVFFVCPLLLANALSTASDQHMLAACFEAVVYWPNTPIEHFGFVSVSASALLHWCLHLCLHPHPSCSPSLSALPLEN